MARQWIAMAVVGLGASTALASCNLFGESDCETLAMPLLSVEIRDAAGRAQAVGSTVTLVAGGARYPQRLTDDSVRTVYYQTGGASVVDVEITKPYYQPVEVRNVRLAGNACAARDNAPVTLPIVLRLAANAPSVRSVHVLPTRVLLDRAPYTSVYTFSAIVDADPGVSTGVRWRLEGDSSGVTLDAQAGTVRYRCVRTSTYPILQAVALADSTIVGTAALAIQGHPAAVNDPPCS